MMAKDERYKNGNCLRRSEVQQSPFVEKLGNVPSVPRFSKDARPSRQDVGVRVFRKWGMREMARPFKVGDHVRWNSEAGRVSGVIIKKITSDMKVKGYVHHASREAPQYLIQSDRTDHIAIHKGAALRLIAMRRKSGRASEIKRKTKR